MGDQDNEGSHSADQAHKHEWEPKQAEGYADPAYSYHAEQFQEYENDPEQERGESVQNPHADRVVIFVHFFSPSFFAPGSRRAFSCFWDSLTKIPLLWRTPYKDR